MKRTERFSLYKHEVENFYVQERILIQKYLDIIANGIKQNNGLIHFGNTNLILKENGIGEVVPFELNSWVSYDLLTDKQKEQAVELYSPDGWETLYDIANWADIVTDYLNAKEMGKDEMVARGYARE